MMQATPTKHPWPLLSPWPYAVRYALLIYISILTFISNGRFHSPPISSVINRAKKEQPDIQARLFAIQNSPDVAEQYISIMNCIFSAKKENVPIDACITSSDGSSLSHLSQAASLTNGVYFKPKDNQGLVQYFLTIWLADITTRQLLKLPNQPSVDFRAMCFCHKRHVSTAFICPVCLSLFCEFQPICSTCGIRSHIIPPKKRLRPQ
jgi:transcription initiation factor TFIIH subunit 3